MIAKEIQKPPYDDKAVAPNVFPGYTCQTQSPVYLVWNEGLTDGHLPHASKQLDETAIAIGSCNHEIGLRDVLCAHVDE